MCNNLEIKKRLEGDNISLLNLLSEQRESSNIYLEEQGLSVTYNELFSRAKNVADELKVIGIKEHNIVLFLIEKSIDFTTALLAVNSLGAVVMPVYIKVGTKSLKAIVQEYKPDYLITSKKYLNDIDMKNISDNSSVHRVVEVRNGKVIQLYQPINVQYYPVSILNECRFLLLSSGTTNLPKAVMLSNDNVIENIISISDYLELTEKDRIILYKNINHASTLIGELLVGLYNGCYIYINTALPSAKFIAQIIQVKKITVLFTVPSFLLDIFQEENRVRLKSIRIVNFYGDKFIMHILDVIKKYPSIQFIFSYGLTEASPRVTYIKTDNILKNPGSSGHAVKNVQILIQTSNREAYPNEIGNIVVKGPNVMLGYYKNEKLTSERMKDGCLYTGDVGYLDDAQLLYVTGRKDNMFIKSGKNIFPEEIESAVLRKYEDVKNVLVVRKTKDKKIEIECYVQWKNNASVTPREMCKSLGTILDDYKIPDKIIYTDDLKVTASGKVKRMQMEERMNSNER